jgi:hypothetical protein
MIKIFIATGYDSYSHKILSKAFLAPSEAEAYMINLTNPSVNTFTAKSYIELINSFLKGSV